MVKSKTFIATPPGVTIKEQLADREMNQKEFAQRMGISEKHISRLINGEVKLTPEMAVRLEMVLGVPAQFWNNLEAIYQNKLAKANSENEMDSDIELAKKFPYNEMSKNGWVPKTSNIKGRVINLRKYFEVVQLSYLQRSLIPEIACRRLTITEKSDFELIAWAQKAKLEARKIKTKPINIKLLKNSLNEIRAMTTMDPKDFCPKLIRLLADCGIALIFLPHMKGPFLHGATFFDKSKIVIGLTVRGKDADRFWFSLFHELAHILYGHIRQSERTIDINEKRADEFAKNTLIPAREYSMFIKHNNFSKESIIDFAKHIKIDVGIVVGRLQKDNYIQYNWFNELKTHYFIAGNS